MFVLRILLIFTFFICSPVLHAQETTKMSITIGSGGTKGTFYPFAVSIAKLLNSKLNVKAEGISTQGSAYNNEKLSKKEMEMAMIQNDVAFYGYEGLENVHQNKEIRAIGTLFSEDVHIVVREKSGIKTFNDMIGKRIAIGNTTSGQYRNAKQILEEAGIFNKIIKDYSEIDTAVEKFNCGEIDGLFYTVGWPASAIKTIVGSTNCRFISLDKPLIDKMVSEYPFYTEHYIPKGAYSNLNENIPTIAVRAMFAVREDLPDSLVYAVSKLIFENTEQLQDDHPKWGSVDLMNSREGVGIPFHPGAEAYFRDNSIVVKSRPYETAPPIGFVKHGERLRIFRDKWNRYKIQTKNGKKGWIEKEKVVNVKPSGSIYVVNVDSLNLRNGHSLRELSKRLLKRGEKVEKIREQYNEIEGITWFEVIRENGDKGWASARYLNTYNDESLSGIIRVRFGESEIHKEAKKNWFISVNEDLVITIINKIKKIQHFFTSVEEETLHEKLDLFEYRNKVPPTGDKPIWDRIKQHQEIFDNKTLNSILGYIKEIEKRINLD